MQRSSRRSVISYVCRLLCNCICHCKIMDEPTTLEAPTPSEASPTSLLQLWRCIRARTIATLNRNPSRSQAVKQSRGPSINSSACCRRTWDFMGKDVPSCDRVRWHVMCHILSRTGARAKIQKPVMSEIISQSCLCDKITENKDGRKTTNRWAQSTSSCR